MVDFTRRRKFVTREPQLKVDAGLDPGTYVFGLMVTDDAGNQSEAAQVKVKIVRTRTTRPVISVPAGTLTGPTRLITG